VLRFASPWTEKDWRRNRRREGFILHGKSRFIPQSAPISFNRVRFAGREGQRSFSIISNLYFCLKIINCLIHWFFVQKLFGEALERGTMQGFFKLISYYQTQSEPAYCGLATLSVVLNALAIDPGRKWKGIDRSNFFFHFFFCVFYVFSIKEEVS